MISLQVQSNPGGNYSMTILQTILHKERKIIFAIFNCNNSYMILISNTDVTTENYSHMC